LKTKYEARTVTALAIVAFFGLQAFAAPPTSMETWKSIMSQGELYESKHDYVKAIQSFRQAASYAEKNALPAHCFETSLCRQTADEVLVNYIAQAGADCDKLMSRIEKEKANKTLDAELEVWVQNLANAYQSNLKPKTREQCLLRLCQIIKVLYGENNKEYKSARALLGKYYEAQHGQAVKAAQIQASSDEEGIRQAEINSDPLQRGFNLNQLAQHCRVTGELDRAKIADLQLVKMAKTYPQIADGLSTYYASLGTIEMAQGNLAQGKSYFAMAIKECSKFRGNKQKEGLVTGSLKALIDAVRTDKNPQIPNLASDELGQLLAVQQAISADPRSQYTPNRLLAEVLNDEHKYEESDKHMERAIEIAKLPNSMVSNDIPGLYMQLAMRQASRGKIGKSNESFAKAITAEKNKTGFEGTRILIFWGGLALERNDLSLATEKLSIAAKQAEALPITKRGTLLIDSLYGLNMMGIRSHNPEIEKSCTMRLIPEINTQIALNNNLGPNFWQKLKRDRFIW
jgi:tetratricopeptide (TPR) repeat protein